MDNFFQFLIFRRIKKFLRDKSIANYKLQKDFIILKLNNYFWDKSKGIDGFYNKIIYKKQIAQLNDAMKKNGHTIESCRKNLAEILNNRTEELITRLIIKDMLRTDNDNPPSYYIRSIAVLDFWELFKWIILYILVMGLVVAIIANLLSNYIWQKIFN